MGYFHGNNLVVEMAHAVDGKQYVAISAGNLMYSFALSDAGPGKWKPLRSMPRSMPGFGVTGPESVKEAKVFRLKLVPFQP